MTYEGGIAHAFAGYLREIDNGESSAIEDEGRIGPGSQLVIKTVPKFMANDAGKYRDLNHGVHVGELSATPIVKIAPKLSSISCGDSLF